MLQADRYISHGILGKSSPIGKHPSKTNHFKICTLSFFEKIGKSKTKNNLGQCCSKVTFYIFYCRVYSKAWLRGICKPKEMPLKTFVYSCTQTGRKSFAQG